MSSRIGVVVETHPEDNSVDLVMTDDGSRLVGVQVLSLDGSSRTGTSGMPKIAKKGDKWDITEIPENYMRAVVAYAGRNPYVAGFLYPQVNQVLFKDPLMHYWRHQSDVEVMVDGEGNLQLNHPGGAYIRIGESPDKVDLQGKNADGNLAIDRNTSRKVSIRVGLADNVVQLTLTKDGDVQLSLDRDMTINVGQDATINVDGKAVIKAADSVTIDTPKTTVKGQLDVEGLLTYKAGMAGSGGASATAVITGNIEVQGGDVKADDISLKQHKTSGVMTGSGTSGVPVP